MKSIFIVGNSRSGTTMLGRVFGNHSKVHTFGELHFFEHLVSSDDIRENAEVDLSARVKLLERLLTTSRESFFSEPVSGKYKTDVDLIIDQSADKTYISSYQSFLNYEARRNHKIIPCEQTPRYLFYIREIVENFPDAYVINMVRDPRDVLLSQKKKWKRRFLGGSSIPFRESLRAWVNYHPYLISRLWVSSVTEISRYADHPRVISMRFEDLLNDPCGCVDELCRFVGIEPEEEMLNIPQVGSSVGSDKPKQIGINPGRAQAWRGGALSSVEIDICQHVAGEQMAVRGYKLEPVASSLLMRWLMMLWLIPKAGGVLLVNLSRARSLIEAIKRRIVV